MSIFDYIIVSIVLACLAAAVRYIVHQRKAGRSVSCGGCPGRNSFCSSCAGCARNYPHTGGKQNENS